MVEITVEENAVGKEVAFTIDGDISLYTEAEIKEVVLPYTSSAFDNLIFNMKTVRYIDSGGIGMLILIDRNCRMKEKHFKLIEVGADVFRILKLGQFDQIFKIEAAINP